MTAKVKSGMPKKKRIIRPEPVKMEIRVLPPTIWRTYSWARHWFEDAQSEAGQTTASDQARDRRRREIVFAVCFAESYLFEWVRDEVLNCDFSRLDEVFGERKPGIHQKWKDVMKRLLELGLMAQLPETGDVQSQEWAKLIDYRDGLVHAVASFPESLAQPSQEGPTPSIQDLEELPAGWALGVAVAQARRLHEAAESSPPDWLQSPR